METLESYAMCSDGGVGCSHVFNQFGKKKNPHPNSLALNFEYFPVSLYKALLLKKIILL